MGISYSSPLSPSLSTTTLNITHSSLFPCTAKANPGTVSDSTFSHTNNISLNNLQKPTKKFGSFFYCSHNTTCLGSKIVPLKCFDKAREMETQEGIAQKPTIDIHGIDEELVQKMVYDALVWSSLHGLVVGDRSVQVCGYMSFCQ
jgi:glutathione synthase